MKGKTLALGITELALLLFVPLRLVAQEAHSFEQLQLLVRPGDTIYVTGEDGDEHKGKVQELSTNTLRLSVRGTTRDWAQREISRIRKWRGDSLKNGAIIGGGGGIGFAALLVGASSCVGIDALIPSKQTIFVPGIRSGLNHMRIAPLLHASGRGVRLAISF
jgi:hypothetical protein